MNIYYLQYESVPTKGSEEYEMTGGAFINCWIKAPSLAAAKIIAEDDIKRNLWEIIQLEESREVTANDYENDDESLEYFHQAEIDSEVYVYHSWPNEPQEGDSIN